MTRNAVFHDSGAFDDGSPIASFPGAVSSVFTRTGAVAAAAGDYYGAVPAALTGATQASRFVGATVSGAPVSGTFAVGDHVLSLADAKWYVCTVAGTPGTWVTPSAGAGVTYGTPALTLGTAAAAGSTDEAIRRDSTIVAFDATAPTTQAFGDSAATGSAAVAARRDHKHAMPAAPTAASVGAQPADSDLTDIAALTPTNDDLVQRKAGAWTNRTIAQLLTDLAAAGTTFQPLDSDLTAIAALSTTSFGRGLLAEASAATARTTLGIAGAVGGLEWTSIIKSGDQDVSSNTTPAADSELKFTAASGGVYEIMIIPVYLSVLGGATPDFKAGFGEDATARGAISSTSVNTSDSIQFNSVTCSTSQSFSFGTAATARAVLMFGVYWGGGGTAALNWSQVTSGTNPTTVKAGSILRYRRIV